MDEALKNRIEEILKSHRIVLFMKGVPEAPQCGFSAQAVSVLHQYGLPFHTVNILEDEELRQGLKEYAQWPTYPQLYVDGELIGGCDIIMELHDTGELEGILKGRND